MNALSRLDYPVLVVAAAVFLITFAVAYWALERFFGDHY